MFVCRQCIRDPLLRLLLTSELQTERICTVCGKTGRNALAPDRIASLIREHLPRHFIVDDGAYPGYALTLGQVVSQATGCEDTDVSDAIATHLIAADARVDGFYWPGQEYRFASSPREPEECERAHAAIMWAALFGS